MNEENELDSTCGVSDKEMTYRFQQGVKNENESSSLRGFLLLATIQTKSRHFLNIQTDTVNMPQ